ncbi:MAG: hypothetical protein ACXVWU_08685 [Nocardioides sp.]
MSDRSTPPLLPRRSFLAAALGSGAVALEPGVADASRLADAEATEPEEG